MDEIRSIGVVGAGQMGCGIAQVAAQAGYQVVLVDAQAGAALRGLERIEAALGRLVDKGSLVATERTATRSRLSVAEALQGLAACDVVIEAATENSEIKAAIFRDLDRVVQPRALLASNTSSISITLLGSHTRRPGQVIGMHFMNPVPVMKLIEVVRGLATDDRTYNAIVALGIRFGKHVITAKDSAGFIINRLLIPFINEACFALQESLGSIEDIDAGIRLGLNHPMGPFALADLIGLDTCLAIAEVLHTQLGDDKYRPAPLLRTYVAAGWLGRKSGRGFYTYGAA